MQLDTHTINCITFNQFSIFLFIISVLMIKITNSLTYLATYFAYKTYLHTLCNKTTNLYDTTMLAYLYSAIDTHFKIYTPLEF